MSGRNKSDVGSRVISASSSPLFLLSSALSLPNGSRLAASKVRASSFPNLSPSRAASQGSQAGMGRPQQDLELGLLRLLQSAGMLSKHHALSDAKEGCSCPLPSSSCTTTGCLNGENRSGRRSAAVWKDGSSITRESFLSTPSPWKQWEDFWARLIDSFIGRFHWDTIHLDLQLISKEEGARRGSSVISSVTANQRQLLSQRLPMPKGEGVWQPGSLGFLELPDTSPLVFLE